MLGPFTNNVITVVGPVSDYINAIIAWEATLNPPGYAPANKLGSIGPAGGIVFYVDYTGLHGLEAQPTNYEIGHSWTSAILVAETYGAGWRLPTKDELNILYQKQSVAGVFNGHYWSSTQFSPYFAWCQNFNTGHWDYYSKTNILAVRAVRAF